MATQYYRVTVYHLAEDLSVIFDSNGMYEKLWQFSSFMLSKGFEIIEVSSDETFLNGNITKSETTDKLILRSTCAGRPEYTTYELNGTTYRAVKVRDKIYIPDRAKKAV